MPIKGNVCEEKFLTSLARIVYLIRLIFTKGWSNFPYGFLNPFGERISLTPSTHPQILSTSQQKPVHLRMSYTLTFIRTHRKSHTKELWGLLGPQDLDLYPCSNTISGHLHEKCFEKIDDFIPLGSQKTPRVPFKVKA